MNELEYPVCCKAYYIDKDPSAPSKCYVFIGSQHSDDVKGRIAKMFEEKKWNNELKTVLKDYFNHDVDSNLFEKSCEYVPIFRNMYDSSTLEYFRMCLQEATQVPMKDYYLWKHRNEENSKTLARSLVVNAISRDGVLSSNRVQEELHFPHEFSEIRLLHTVSAINSSNELNEIVSKVAIREFKHMPLSVSNVSDPFDVEACVFRSLKQESEESNAESFVSLDSTSVIYFTTLSTIEKEFKAYRGEINLSKLLNQYTVPTSAITQNQLKPLLDSAEELSLHIAKHKDSNIATHIHDLVLQSQVQVKPSSLEQLVQSFCTSLTVPVAAYIDDVTKDRQFSLFAPTMRINNSIQQPIVSKTQMLKWMREGSEWPVKAKAAKRSFFKVLLGQSSTKRFITAVIDDVTDTHTTLSFRRAKNHPIETMTVSFNTLNFLNSNVIHTKALLLSKKNIKMYSNSAIHIISKDESNSTFYIQYLNGLRENQFQYIHSSFVHVDNDTVLAMDTVSHYATIHLSETYNPIISYHTRGISKTHIPRLSKKSGIVAICNSFIGHILKIEGQKTFDLSTTHESKFSYTLNCNTSLTAFSMFMRKNALLQNYVLEVPTIIFEKGSVVKFRQTAKGKWEDGVVTGFYQMKYTIRRNTTLKEVKVSIFNVDYENTGTIRLVPYSGKNRTNAEAYWIIWCLLRQIPQSNIASELDGIIGRIDKTLLLQTVTSFEITTSAEDYASFKLMYKKINKFIEIQISGSTMTSNFINVSDAFQPAALRIISFIQKNSESGVPIAERNSSQPSEPVKQQKIAKILTGNQFDDWSDADESYSDSEEDEPEKNNVESKTESKSEETMIIQPAVSIIDRIQRFDSYFKNKDNFKEGYARSCQRSSGSQPLVLSKKEFEHVKGDFLSKFGTYVATNTKFSKWSNQMISVCKKNGENDLNKSVCAALEFRNNMYVCPNVNELLTTVEKLLPVNVKTDLKTQQFAKKIFIGLNASKAPCCFLKKNKNLSSYVTTLEEDDPMDDKLKQLYTPYIKDWGHRLNPNRFGFFPPTVYQNLKMIDCPMGNITYDSNHDCLLRLGVKQGPDVFLNIFSYLYSFVFGVEEMDTTQFKIFLTKELLSLQKKNSSHPLLTSLKRSFSMGGFTAIQNFIEYIQSPQKKHFKDVKDLFNFLFEESPINLVILTYDGELKIDCINTAYPKETSHYSYIFHNINTGTCELMVSVKSSKFLTRHFRSIDPLFDTKSSAQGQFIVDLFKTEIYNCKRHSVSVKEEKNLSRYDYDTYSDLKKKIEDNKNGRDFKISQVEDAYGKVIGLHLTHAGLHLILPTNPSPLIPSEDVFTLNTSTIPLSDADDTISAIEKFIDELKLPHYKPVEMIGKETISAIVFRSGYVFPVKPTEYISMQHEVKRSSLNVSDDVNKMIEESINLSNRNAWKFKPVPSFEEVKVVLDKVGRFANTVIAHSLENNVSTILIEQYDKILKSKLVFGLHVIDKNGSLEPSKLKEKLVVKENECIKGLMHFWRQSEYSVPCRPFRYLLNNECEYEHIVLETGQKLQLDETKSPAETIEEVFRNQRLAHVELHHFSDLWRDTDEHLNTSNELKENEDFVIRQENEILRHQIELTDEIQQKISEVVNSSDTMQSRYLSLGALGYSDYVVSELVNNHLFLQQFIPKLKQQCPDTIRLSAADSRTMELESFYTKAQMSYFLDLQNFEEIESVDVQEYDYELFPDIQILTIGTPDNKDLVLSESIEYDYMFL